MERACRSSRKRLPGSSNRRHVWPGSARPAKDILHERSSGCHRLYSSRSVRARDALRYLVLVATRAAGTQTLSSAERDVRARLVAREIPEPITTEVATGKRVSEAELVPLTYQQRAAVHAAHLSASAQKVGAGAATVIAGGFRCLLSSYHLSADCSVGSSSCESGFCSVRVAEQLHS